MTTPACPVCGRWNDPSGGPEAHSGGCPNVGQPYPGIDIPDVLRVDPATLTDKASVTAWVVRLTEAGLNCHPEDSAVLTCDRNRALGFDRDNPHGLGEACPGHVSITGPDGPAFTLPQGLAYDRLMDKIWGIEGIDPNEIWLHTVYAHEGIDICLSCGLAFDEDCCENPIKKPRERGICRHCGDAITQGGFGSWTHDKGSGNRCYEYGPFGEPQDA